MPTIGTCSAGSRPGLSRRAGGPAADWTACPPNWLRSAATARIAGEASCREAKRANNAAVITGSGTAWAIAASMVHRPSPESWHSRGSRPAPGRPRARRQQVQQPGADHRAARTGLKRRRHVVDQLGRRQQLVALGVGLHQPVLDAVVHHLREVPGTDRAGVHEALLAGALGAQRVEDRHRLLDVLPEPPHIRP